MYGVNLGGCEVGPGYNGPTSFPTAFHGSLVGHQALQTCKKMYGLENFYEKDSNILQPKGLWFKKIHINLSGNGQIVVLKSIVIIVAFV